MNVIKQRDLQYHNVHASLARLESDTYELTISEVGTRSPLTQMMLFADSRRDAARQFDRWLDFHFPKPKGKPVL